MKYLYESKDISIISITIYSKGYSQYRQTQFQAMVGDSDITENWN